MIYLDQAATSWPKPARVVEAVNYMITNVSANPGRGNYGSSLEALNLVNCTREKVANFLGVPNRRGVVFTSSATEAINAVLLGTLKPGDHVITSTLEHNAVARTLFALEKKGIIKKLSYGLYTAVRPHLEPKDDIKVKSTTKQNNPKEPTKFVILSTRSITFENSEVVIGDYKITGNFKVEQYEKN